MRCEPGEPSRVENTSRCVFDSFPLSVLFFVFCCFSCQAAREELRSSCPAAVQTREEGNGPRSLGKPASASTRRSKPKTCSAQKPRCAKTTTTVNVTPILHASARVRLHCTVLSCTVAGFIFQLKADEAVHRLREKRLELVEAFCFLFTDARWLI